MGRILVVEDDSEINQLVRVSLREKFLLSFTTNAYDARELLDIYKYNLIILDINLPFLSGFQFASSIDNMGKNKYTPILFISSRNESSDINRAKRLGASGYLVKPFFPDDLRQKVMSIVGTQRANQNALIDFASQGIESTAYVNLSLQFRILTLSDNCLCVSSDTGLPVGTRLEIAADFLQRIGIVSLRTIVSGSEMMENNTYKMLLEIDPPSTQLTGQINVEIDKLGLNSR